MIEAIKNIFSAISTPDDKLSFTTVAATYRNPTTKKRIIVTGVNNGVVEFVEEDDTENFSFSALKYVDVEKKRVNISEMKDFLEKEGWL